MGSCFRLRKRNSYTVNHDDAIYSQNSGKYFTSEVVKKDATSNRDDKGSTNGVSVPSGHTQSLFAAQQRKEKQAQLQAEFSAERNTNGYPSSPSSSSTDSNQGTIGSKNYDSRAETPDTVAMERNYTYQNEVHQPKEDDVVTAEVAQEDMSFRIAEPPTHVVDSKRSSNSSHSERQFVEDQLDGEIQDTGSEHVDDKDTYDDDEVDVPAVVTTGAIVTTQTSYSTGSAEAVDDIQQAADVSPPAEEQYDLSADEKYLESPAGTWDARLNKDVSAELERLSSSSLSSLDKLEPVEREQELEDVEEHGESSAQTTIGVSVIRVGDSAEPEDEDEERTVTPSRMNVIHEEEEEHYPIQTTNSEYHSSVVVVNNDSDTDIVGDPENSTFTSEDKTTVVHVNTVSVMH